jgi:formamidopyrimidine-DNA glycosylase
MPELAEVEYYRKQWNEGVGEKITGVDLHADKRIFRGTNTDLLTKALTGATLKSSQARGKQMVFRFSKDCWLGIHLGMTGKMSTQLAGYEPAKHDHLVLRQKQRTLVFEDMRQFGRVHFSQSAGAPEWWSDIAIAPNEDGFTFAHMQEFLKRRKRLSVKGVLLVQEGFPGVGNWMADEILWRAKLNPAKLVGDLTATESKALWKETRMVCKVALEKIGDNFGDPPKGWLFHERWSRKGVCPKHKEPLERATIGGRTTAWCAKCQK